MIVREAATLIIIAVMSTVLALQAAEKFQGKQHEQETTVCVEYFDDAGHKIRECEYHEAKQK